MCSWPTLPYDIPRESLKNLSIRVKDTFIFADFVVLDMEGNLGISLILGLPFLRDAKARIDVRTGKISFLIMGKEHEIQVPKQEGTILDS